MALSTDGEGHRHQGQRDPMRVPTVRIVHPSDLSSFVTINQADLTPAHDLWPDQAEGYEPLHTPAAFLDRALRDAAASLCLRMLAFKRRAAGEPFAELAPAEQMAIVREMDGELDRAIADFDEGQQPQADSTVRITKGPRGRWYVKRGADTVAGPFEAEAQAEEAAATA